MNRGTEGPQVRASRPGGKAVLLAKAVISIAILLFLLSQMRLDELGAAMRQLSPWAFTAAVGLYLFASWLSALRWGLLIPHPFTQRRLFSLYIIGSFFNTCMPGTIGGDAVKAYYLGQELKERGEEGHAAVAVASVFMDRYIGLAALLFIPVAVMPLGLPFLETIPGGLPVKWLLPLTFGSFLVLTFILFRIKLGARVRFLLKVYDYLHHYRSQAGILVRSFSYSIIIQLSGILAVYTLARGMGIDVGLVSLLIFVPLIILITILPVSISGIGVREGAFAFFLGSLGVPSSLAVSLSLIWFLSVAAASLWGVAEYWRYRQGAGGREQGQG
ncbi:MAG: lysylphosphatidylglycerol synthase transmembrane domain-containing protein [Thermodesulfovibrionales bacterium]|jgi:hypothetical protein